jgi:HSP20 family protein
LAIERWDPFGDMLRFRHMIDRMFEEGYGRQRRPGFEHLGYNLPIDVCETGDEYLVRAAVPGVHPQDIDVSVKEDTVTIRGQLREPEWLRRETHQHQATGQPTGQTQQTGQQPRTGQYTGQTQQTGQGQGYSYAGTECWLQEIPYGRFSRTITLPTPINSNNARAEFDNGMLILHLPKTEEARPRRIEVQPGAQRQQIGVGTGGTTGQTPQR